MDKKTFWPYGILIILFIGAGLAITTVTIAIRQGIKDDTSYLESSKAADKDINEIIKLNKAFAQSYKVGVVANAASLTNIDKLYISRYYLNIPLFINKDDSIVVGTNFAIEIVNETKAGTKPPSIKILGIKARLLNKETRRALKISRLKKPATTKAAPATAKRAPSIDTAPSYYIVAIDPKGIVPRQRYRLILEIEVEVDKAHKILPYMGYIYVDTATK